MTDAMTDTRPLVYLIAGEPSGDRLGAGLMAALKAETGGAIDFTGIGGPAMQAEGLESLFPMSDLAVMGVAEVVPRLLQLLRRIREAVADARRKKPSVMVTIDSPDFSFRVAKQLKGQGFPLVHYVAPSVWAWRPGRARKIARFLDHVLCLLPFEPDYFTVEGLDATFIGHPVVDAGGRGDGAAFRARHGIAADAPLMLMLPGSRHSETSRLLPVFADTVARLAEQFPGLAVATPTVATVADAVRAAVDRWPVAVNVVEGDDEKWDAMAAAGAALAASGTVALELAVAGCPSVIAYRLSPASALFARRIIGVDYVNLVNLTLDRPAVPELLLEDCRSQKLVPAMAELLGNEAAREAQRQAYQQALAALGRDGASPSTRAARAVLGVLGNA